MKRAFSLVLCMFAAAALVVGGGAAPAGARASISGATMYASGPQACGAGWDCNWDFDITIGTWMEADLYYCGTYGLVAWGGAGYVTNNQTGGTILAYSMDNVGAFVQGWYNTNTLYTANWDPAWSIKPC